METKKEYILDNGLHLCIIKRLAFKECVGMLGVHVGASSFAYQKSGIAHFLEHMMFHYGDQEVDSLFLEYGANVNAYTAYNRTCYYFNSYDHIYDCIELLLNFVTNFKVDYDKLLNERDIIIKEIEMYDNDYDYKASNILLQKLYQNHPLSIDICGTVYDVKGISKKDLERFYNYYYTLDNMVLCIVGNVDESKIIDIANKFKNHSRDMISHKYYYKNNIIELENYNLAILHHLVTVKIQCDYDIEIKLAFELLLDIYFSKSSDFYDKYHDLDIINDSFSYAFTMSDDYAYIEFSLNHHKKGFNELLIDYLNVIIEATISEEEFNRAKRKEYGRLIQARNGNEEICDLYILYYFENNDCFEVINILKDLQIDTLERCKELLKEAAIEKIIVQ